MKENQETQLHGYYEQFSVCHEQRRNQLLGSVSKIQSSRVPEAVETAGRWGFRPVLKSSLALAAGLMIVLGAIFYVWQDLDPAPSSDPGARSVSLNPLSAQEVYAAAIDRVAQVTSVHFIWTTPSGGSTDASMKMWWRYPNDYRMEFAGNGLVMAGNEKQHYTYDPSKDTLKVNEGAGLYVFPLEQLGRLFSTKDDRLAKQWIDESTIVRSEPVDYKGEKCLKVICVHKISQNRYEYIIDSQAGTDTRVPFYEVKQYSHPEGGRLMSHVEVLEVNKEYADRMFTIEK